MCIKLSKLNSSIHRTSILLLYNYTIVECYKPYLHYSFFDLDSFTFLVTSPCILRNSDKLKIFFLNREGFIFMTWKEVQWQEVQDCAWTYQYQQGARILPTFNSASLTMWRLSCSRVSSGHRRPAVFQTS